ncbi:Gamma-glutamyl cyclotransferase, AIG2-like [Cognatiyoonia sediminum]|uniref:Gamma-glutamyl cyclotransferase, AIG2-like n=1 Tax=Cognatiyoonia sediminum TaxID=1508389 RepID=A0A1M5NW87_9RHOB|nr:gamma-glutamylcyclotransferase family protein [Cognatiyoonia sediminum]SHG93738.1 Gamma-glutamyl cyclotransferase, AIG2-like [Cognatiyoonia sediminum]
MTDPQFFGYGSLVNLQTHDYANPRPATLKGWKRVWQQSKERNVAFLSVLPSADTEIEGLLACVPNGDWAALDLREHQYDRIDVTNAMGQSAPTAVYQGQPAKIADGALTRPFLLSYLDVIIDGFLEHFGEDGVQRFFKTTDRWDTPALNDRQNPIYPRYVQVSPDALDLVDHHLSKLPTVVKQPM